MPLFLIILKYSGRPIEAQFCFVISVAKGLPLSKKKNEEEEEDINKWGRSWHTIFATPALRARTADAWLQHAPNVGYYQIAT